MYPSCWEIELNAVNVGYLYVLFVSVKFLDLGENGIYIGLRSEVDAVLCNEVFRVKSCAVRLPSSPFEPKN